jgi:hypothetical protein
MTMPRTDWLGFTELDPVAVAYALLVGVALPVSAR